MINEVIDDLIKNKPYKLSSEDKKHLDKGRVKELIFKKVTSSKFRKSSMDNQTKELVKNYISKCVDNKKPIVFYILFGGYKQDRLASSPYPDWAEIFNLNFHLNISQIIAAIYEPGIHTIYRSDAKIANYIDNYKLDNLKIYKDRFKEYVEIFNDIVGDINIRFSFEEIDKYIKFNEIIGLTEKLYEKHKNKFENLEEEYKNYRINRALRNIVWEGELDLSSMTLKQKHDKAKWAVINSSAYLEADLILNKEYFSNVISIMHRKSVPGCIHYGTCSSSTVQFWAGEGCLVKRKDSFIPYILSYKQIDEVNKESVRVDNDIFRELGLKNISKTEKFIR